MASFTITSIINPRKNTIETKHENRHLHTLVTTIIIEQHLLTFGSGNDAQIVGEIANNFFSFTVVWKRSGSTKKGLEKMQAPKKTTP
jgi:hypothetical protein